jgi:hypothetical protein
MLATVLQRERKRREGGRDGDLWRSLQKKEIERERKRERDTKKEKKRQTDRHKRQRERGREGASGREGGRQPQDENGITTLFQKHYAEESLYQIKSFT